MATIDQERLDGSPAHVKEQFIDIKFQLGPVKENGVNGTQVEHIIEILVKRLEGFQNGPYSCRENSLAITKLQEAMLWLDFRTRKRITRDIEGTSNP